MKGYEVLSREGYIGVVETFKDMHHDWIGARANLEDEKKMRESLGEGICQRSEKCLK